MSARPLVGDHYASPSCRLLEQRPPGYSGGPASGQVSTALVWTPLKLAPTPPMGTRACTNRPARAETRLASALARAALAALAALAARRLRRQEPAASGRASSSGGGGIQRAIVVRRGAQVRLSLLHRWRALPCRRRLRLPQPLRLIVGSHGLRRLLAAAAAAGCGGTGGEASAPARLLVQGGCAARGSYERSSDEVGPVVPRLPARPPRHVCEGGSRLVDLLKGCMAEAGVGREVGDALLDDDGRRGLGQVLLLHELADRQGPGRRARRRPALMMPRWTGTAGYLARLRPHRAAGREGELGRGCCGKLSAAGTGREAPAAAAALLPLPRSPGPSGAARKTPSEDCTEAEERRPATLPRLSAARLRRGSARKPHSRPLEVAHLCRGLEPISSRSAAVGTRSWIASVGIARPS